MGFEQLAQPIARGYKQGRRLGPLLKNGAAGKSTPGQARDQPFQASGVFPGWSGEQGQVAVAIAIIFVEVQMDDRKLLGQSIQETPVVVPRGQTKIGVAEVQTHPRVRERKVATLVQRSKEAIEVVGDGEHGV